MVDATFADRVFSVTPALEANEAAFKLARRYSKEKFGEEKKPDHRLPAKVFHGRTFFTVSVGGQSHYSDGFGPRPVRSSTFRITIPKPESTDFIKPVRW